MVKSITGLLIGIAISEGAIKSVDDIPETYVPGFMGTEYGRTPIRDLLHMSSGVDFGEAKPMPIPVGGGRAKPGDSVTLGIRPEHLGEGTRHAMVLTGTVDAVEHLGEASYVHVRRDDGTVLTARSPGDSRAEVGSKISVSTDVEHLHLFDPEGKAFSRHSKADAA